MNKKLVELRYSGREAQRLLDKQMLGRPGDMEESREKQVKFFFERLIVLLSLIFILVPMSVIYLLVRLTSAGPGIFKQVRVGQGGKIFTMYKFRTMSVDAESKTGPMWSTGSGDPRHTPVGRFLRFLHLDELPQLWNVLKGEMSLIGPRPERPVFVLMLSEEVDGYLDRLTVRPGIAGLAQVYLEPDISIECVRKKIVFDKIYIQSESLLLDAQIILCALARMFGIRHGRGPRWFGLDRFCKRSGLIQTEPAASEELSNKSESGWGYRVPVPAMRVRPGFQWSGPPEDSGSQISKRKPK